MGLGAKQRKGEHSGKSNKNTIEKKYNGKIKQRKRNTAEK